MLDKQIPFSPERGKNVEKPFRQEVGVSWSELLKELDGEASLAEEFVDTVSTDPDAKEELEDMEAVLRKIGLARNSLLVKIETALEKGGRALSKKEGAKNRQPLEDLKDLNHYISEINDELRKKRSAQTKSFVRQTSSEKYAYEPGLFGDEDLLTDHFSLIRRFEKTIASIDPLEVKKYLSGRADRYHSDYLISDFNHSVENVCFNLADNEHIDEAADLWIKAHELGLNVRESNPYFNKDGGSFFEGLKYLLARQTVTTEPNVSINEALKNPSHQSSVAKAFESRFAKNPAFLAQCVIRLSDVFPRFQKIEDTEKLKLSNEYVRVLEELVDLQADEAVRDVVKSLVSGIPGYVYIHVLRDAVKSIDPVLRNHLFQACLRSEKDPLGIVVQDSLGLFDEEIEGLSDEDKDRCFAMMTENINDLIGFEHRFFVWIHKLHLSLDKEREILDLIRKQGHQNDAAKFFKCFSREAQVDIATHSDKAAMLTLGEGIYPIDKNLPRAIAGRMIEVGLTKIVADHESAFEDLGEEIKRRIENYRLIVQKVEQSPSRTVRRMKDALIEELSASADPERTYERIESIFLRNHIPLAGKVFLAFETIYGESRVKAAYSPTLKEAGSREARWLIYKDLINIHLDTGNPSLREYLEDLKMVLPAIEKVKTGHEAELTPQETDMMDEFLRKINVLREVSTYKTIHGKVNTTPAEGGYAEKITHWETSLGVRAGQNLNERLEEMYLRPAGVNTIDQALARMGEAESRADHVNRELVTTSNGTIALREGDLLKRVQSEYFLSYLQNGNVAKECLGYAAGHDYTALDTDTGKVLPQDLEKGNRGALQASPAADTQYGDIVLVFRPTSDRFFETRTGEPTHVRDQIRGKTPPYEIFQTPVVDKDRHFGIRTGVPFTEVRCIIVPEPDKRRRELLDLKMDIVANGYYVPLVDEDGKVLFSTEEFDRLKNLFAGSEASPDLVPVIEQRKRNSYDQEIESVQRALEGEAELIEKAQQEIQSRIVRVLRELGIPLRMSGELAIGAEILHVGSTARRTSIPGQKIDFDITVRLDENDLTKQKAIIEKLDEQLPGSYVQGANTQWRRADIEILGRKLDIDIAFTSKPEVEGTPSHTMVEQRLGAIEKANSQDGNWVRANIVYAKQVLKKAGIYKKMDGGLGGLGVENWVLQSGGSFARARQDLLEAAIDQKGELREFEDFSKQYSILDPGVNLIEDLDGNKIAGRKNYRHDNFIYFLQKEGTDGYKKIVSALQAI